MTGVTIALSRRLRPGTETAFELWLKNMTAAAARYLGATVLRPPHPRPRSALPSGRPFFNAIPELAPQWKKLDLVEILSRPAAYVSVSQTRLLYEPSGAQGSEKHW